MKFSTSKSTAILVFLCGFVSMASAQSSEVAEFKGPDTSKDRGRVSLGVSSAVEYSGDEMTKVRFQPALEYQWANGWFAGTNRGLGYNFSKDDALQYGLGLGLDLGRKEATTGKLVGMGSIDAKVEYGGFLNYEIARSLRVSSVFRYGSGNEGNGATANLGINYSTAIAPNWSLGFGISTTWANSQYMQSYFGVSSAQSTASGHAEYSPGAGFKDVNTSLNLNYRVAPNVSISGGLQATRLLGDAKSSPVVAKDQDISGSLSVGYEF